MDRKRIRRNCRGKLGLGREGNVGNVGRMWDRIFIVPGGDKEGQHFTFWKLPVLDR